ncbi:ADP-ribosylhydrolase ARH1-like isoform X2 [Liolophura sinensis]
MLPASSVMAVSYVERYIAAMVLSGVGDALGYKNGSWEFCNNGSAILDELKAMGGLSSINIKGWMVSDDTVMHLATAEALCEESGQSDMEKLYMKIAKKYKECMSDMTGRGPGHTCLRTIRRLNLEVNKGYQITFDPSGGGCGAAMRAMCIGLRYSDPSDLDKLIAVSVESGRMSHHHPTGYLGSLASALFTSYSIQGKPVAEWGAWLLEVVDKAREYVISQGHHVAENMQNWSYFTDHWRQYLSQRGILDGKSMPKFPDEYGVKERDLFYKTISYSGWGGASGHDAPMIAYDALLYASDNWNELCNRAMFHGGDSDSTGVIAGACYGAMHGFKGVPKGLYKNLEYRDRLEQTGKKLYSLSHGGAGCEAEDTTHNTPASRPTAQTTNSD